MSRIQERTDDGLLLEVEGLSVSFQTRNGEVVPVDGISLAVQAGETVCIVGESGSGKSVTSLSILRLLGDNGRIREGDVRLKGENLASLSEERLRRIRGKEISMIFQEPMTSLNPVFPIGSQLVEAIKLHTDLRGRAAKSRAVEVLRDVGIARPEAVYNDYPHALSGGMRQRVVIAMALACQPSLLIADEPTTALDVTIQAQILELLKQLQERNGMAILLITHDLGVVAEMADRVIVMYAGQIVEEADVYSIFENPRHPYTQGLLRSLPSTLADHPGRLEAIPGSVPSLRHLPAGCRFHPRCPHAEEACKRGEPELESIGGSHKVRCPVAFRGNLPLAAGAEEAER
ncbi:ABC transporter ATP-binding protein [Cohnella sp. AR92]|uniref:ABC transporter ATP-binding protein n=1 Tax=Cohnella sp. AR92 TaxID=648716 RepID=UPI000F8C5A01|nr:ABC transporter ATP-binding protein [Cohnella sp. AR92]RUS48609.1 ABC transporter ATP-binding protein [Cohnella sp. AR92]